MSANATQASSSIYIKLSKSRKLNSIEIRTAVSKVGRAMSSMFYT